jgi:hypothetical protein
MFGYAQCLQQHFFFFIYVMDETFPDFTSPMHWYDIVMLCTDCRNKMKAICNSGHARFAYAALKSVHLTVNHGGQQNGHQ